MKFSARNQLKGTVSSIDKGSVNSLVHVDVSGQMVESVITNEAVDDMGLAQGDAVVVIVKASNVILGK